MEKEPRESQEAFERYEIILGILHDNNDSMGLKLLDGLINKCIRYVDIVSNYERILKLQKFRKSEEEFIEELERFEDIRKMAHESLISDLKILNRYLFNNYSIKIIPIGGIYSLKPETLSLPDKKSRQFIGNWAGYITGALYRRGVIKLNA